MVSYMQGNGCNVVLQVMGRIDSLIMQAQKRGYAGEPVVSVPF